MKIFNRLACAWLVCASLIFAHAQSLPRINRDEDARPRELISEGLGVGRIYVGHSTADDVASVYGKTFETIEHGNYSYELRYASLGLSFWYCREDKQKHIFDINAVAPFVGFTARGIVLGKSTLGDVIKAYGQDNPTTTTSAGESWVFAYPGIKFTIPHETTENKPVSSFYGVKITAIDVVTSRSGSDCLPSNIK
jgi:hypothetical protein